MPKALNAINLRVALVTLQRVAFVDNLEGQAMAEALINGLRRAAVAS